MVWKFFFTEFGGFKSYRIMAHIASRGLTFVKNFLSSNNQIRTTGRVCHFMMYLFELTSLDFCHDHSSIKVTDRNIPGHLINITIIPLNRGKNI